MPFVRKSKKSFGRKRSFKKKVLPKAKVSFVSRVKKALQRVAEVKTQSYAAGAVLGGYPYSGIDNQIFPLSPYGGFVGLAQGTGQGDRIGNKLRTKKCYFNYVLYPNPYHATSNTVPQPVDLKMWFFVAKNVPTTLLAATAIDDFFQDGNTNVTPNGSIQDMIRKVNTDAYILKGTRYHKVGYAFDGGTGVQVANQSYANNDYKYNCKGCVDVTKWMPAVVTFEDTSQFPNSNLLMVWMECVPAGGGVLDGNQAPISIAYQIDYMYTDV